LFFVSWWNFSSLVDARAAAARFLRGKADLLNGEGRDALRRAAVLYEQEGARLGEGVGRKDAFLGPWSGRTIGDWLPAVRQREVEILGEARRTEAQAIAEIEKALAAEGVKVEAPAPGVGTGGTPVTTNASGKRLDDMKMVPFWMSHVGGLVSCAEYLKVKASRAWVYGGCGHAFALNICEVPCPSGPTAWGAEKCDALAANVGLKVEAFNAYRKTPDYVQARDTVWRKTREAIDAGRPCFGWNMDYPEWFPICGYDAEGNYLFLFQDNSVGRRHNTKLGETDIGVACILAVSACPPADDRTVVREAARFALEHAAGKHSRARWQTGLPACDRWMTWLQDEKLYAPDGAGFGQAFNAQCWAECRHYAVAFLEEAKRRLPDGDLAPHFEEAIRQYRAVSTSFDAVAKSFPETMENGKAMDERLRDPERRAEALKSLAAAREAEVAGLRALARLAVALGAKDVKPDEVGTPDWIALPPGPPATAPTTTAAPRRIEV
jgi:hypothetical protein